MQFRLFKGNCMNYLQLSKLPFRGAILTDQEKDNLSKDAHDPVTRYFTIGPITLITAFNIN